MIWRRIWGVLRLRCRGGRVWEWWWGMMGLGVVDFEAGGGVSLFDLSCDLVGVE